MILLKQSTSVVIPFGPFLSPSDGVTLVTSLVSAIDHASTGIFLNKNGGAGTIRHASVTASTYDAYGNYLVTLDTTDTNTLGRLRVGFAAAASCLPVWQDFMVVAANIFDALVGASVGLKVDVDTVKTQAVTCAASVTMLASVGTAATSTAQTGDNYARIGAPVGASISADIAAKPSASTNATTLLDQTLSGHGTSGTVGGALNTTPMAIHKNVALAAFPFVMVDATGAPLTGLTVTASRSIDGAAFAGCANSVVEIGNGWYKLDLNASDLNGKTIGFLFSATGAQDTDFTIVTQV